MYTHGSAITRCFMYFTMYTITYLLSLSYTVEYHYTVFVFNFAMGGLPVDERVNGSLHAHFKSCSLIFFFKYVLLNECEVHTHGVCGMITTYSLCNS